MLAFPKNYIPQGHDIEQTAQLAVMIHAKVGQHNAKLLWGIIEIETKLQLILFIFHPSNFCLTSETSDHHDWWWSVVPGKKALD